MLSFKICGSAEVGAGRIEFLNDWISRTGSVIDENGLSIDALTVGTVDVPVAPAMVFEWPRLLLSSFMVDNLRCLKGPELDEFMQEYLHDIVQVTPQWSCEPINCDEAASVMLEEYFKLPFMTNTVDIAISHVNVTADELVLTCGWIGAEGLIDKVYVKLLRDYWLFKSIDFFAETDCPDIERGRAKYSFTVEMNPDYAASDLNDWAACVTFYVGEDCTAALTLTPVMLSDADEDGPSLHVLDEAYRMGYIAGLGNTFNAYKRYEDLISDAIALNDEERANIYWRFSSDTEE